MKRRDFIALIGGAAGLSVVRLVAGAEEPATRVLEFMSARSPEDSARELAAFRKGLEQNGLTEGRNLKVEYRWAHGDYSRLPALAAELVGLQVGVLLAGSGDVSAFAAKSATSTIPIVFVMGGDPIKAGLVDSYNRPGRNADRLRSAAHARAHRSTRTTDGHRGGAAGDLEFAGRFAAGI